MTHDLRIMIITYRLRTCFTNSRHVATHNQNQAQSVRHYVVIATKPRAPIANPSNSAQLEAPPTIPQVISRSMQ